MKPHAGRLTVERRPGRLFVSDPMGFPICRRARLHIFRKHAAEINRVLKPALFRDFVQRQLGVGEQRPGFRKPRLGGVANGGDAVRRLEAARELRRSDAQTFRELLQRQPAFERMLPYVRRRSLHQGIAAAIPAPLGLPPGANGQIQQVEEQVLALFLVSAVRK